VAPAALWPAFWLATLSTAAPTFLIAAGIKLAGSQSTAIIGTLSPLITIALGVSNGSRVPGQTARIASPSPAHAQSSGARPRVGGRVG